MILNNFRNFVIRSSIVGLKFLKYHSFVPTLPLRNLSQKAYSSRPKVKPTASRGRTSHKRRQVRLLIEINWNPSRIRKLNILSFPYL